MPLKYVQLINENDNSIGRPFITETSYQAFLAAPEIGRHFRVRDLNVYTSVDKIFKDIFTDCSCDVVEAEKLILH